MSINRFYIHVHLRHYLQRCFSQNYQFYSFQLHVYKQCCENFRLLPVKENFLCRPIFKNPSKITSYDIDRVFKLYDRVSEHDWTRLFCKKYCWQDKNGTIENEELHGFIKDLLELAQQVRHFQFNSARLKACMAKPKIARCLFAWVRALLIGRSQISVHMAPHVLCAVLFGWSRLFLYVFFNFLSFWYAEKTAQLKQSAEDRLTKQKYSTCLVILYMVMLKFLT